MTYAAPAGETFPGDDLTPGRITLIEFTVTRSEQVQVGVVESGFAGLEASDELKNQSIESNSGGWTEELGSLRTRAED